MEKGLVSVIVPVYKVEKYLPQCIESIINQEYSELEIILVDDGSPDNCGKICDEYEKRDSRIRAIHKANGGLSDARNAGIDAAAGAYITCVDSDDLIHSRYVLRMMELMREDVDLVVCASRKFADGTEPGKTCSIFETPDVFTSAEALRELLRQDGQNFEPSACGKLYRRELFDNDLRFPLGVYCEDLALTYRLVDRAKKTVRTKEPLYYYRQRAESIMDDGKIEWRCGILNTADEMREYILYAHPELERITNARVISAYCHILIRLPDDGKWDKLKTHIYLKVKELRSGLLFYDCRMENKVAVLCSYGGEKLFLALMKRLGKYKK